MIRDNDIIDALDDLKLRADQVHAEEMVLVHEVTCRLQDLNENAIHEMDAAIAQYHDGRKRLAQKLLEATLLLRPRQATRSLDAAPRHHDEGHIATDHNQREALATAQTEPVHAPPQVNVEPLRNAAKSSSTDALQSLEAALALSK